MRLKAQESRKQQTLEDRVPMTIAGTLSAVTGVLGLGL